MTTKIIAIVMAVFFFMQTKAQLYFNAGVGYGLAAAPGGYLTNGTSNNGTVYNYTNTVKSSLSYGKGTQVLFAAGTMINTNIGVELGISYLAGANNTSNYVVTGGGSFNNYNETATYVGSMLRMCPTLVLTTGKGKVTPYMKTGLVVGVSPKIKETYNTVYDNGNIDFQKFEEQGNTSFGFTNCLGVHVGLSKSLSFFSEFNIITQAWSPKKRLMIIYTQNGVDQMATQPNYYKETDYLSVVSYNGTTDFNAPRQSTKVSFAFSSIGLNVGVHMTLGSKGSSKQARKK